MLNMKICHSVIYESGELTGLNTDKELEKFIQSHLPMTETAFYMLLSLQVPRHGYGIIKYVDELTEGRIKLGSGTIYGTINKMIKSEIIEVYDDSDKKIVYVITDKGRALLAAEKERILHLYRDSLTADDGSFGSSGGDEQ